MLAHPGVRCHPGRLDWHTDRGPLPPTLPESLRSHSDSRSETRQTRAAAPRSSPRRTPGDPDPPGTPTPPSPAPPPGIARAWTFLPLRPPVPRPAASTIADLGA